MISLASNLDDVMGRVMRLKEKRIPAAMASAIAPVVWKDAAIGAARRVLAALATGDQVKFIEPFVREAYVTVMEGRLVMGMRAPDSRISLAAAQLALGPAESGGSALGAGSDGGLSDGQKFAEINVPEEAMIELEQKVVDWVANQKRWDVKRDGEKTAANIYAKAQWIIRLMLAPPGALSKSPVQAEPRPGHNTMSEQDARESLLPAVLEYIADQNKEHGQQRSLDAKTASIWLLAVLAIWSALVRDSYRNQVVLELRKAEARPAIK